MRGTWVLVAVSLVAVGPLAACSDDDAGAGATTTSDQLSTEGVCEVLDPARASRVMGVDFDRAVSAERSCTYTSSTPRTAFTLQISDLGSTEPDLVLETMGGSCDEGTRQDRTVPGAQAAFSCLAGGIPNAVATAHRMVFVLTGNSQDEAVTPEMVTADLLTLLADAVSSSPES
jgi:hypothetical protein